MAKDYGVPLTQVAFTKEKWLEIKTALEAAGLNEYAAEIQEVLDHKPEDHSEEVV